MLTFVDLIGFDNGYAQSCGTYNDIEETLVRTPMSLLVSLDGGFPGYHVRFSCFSLNEVFADGFNNGSKI